MNNEFSIRFPRNFFDCQSLSDVESAINSGDYYREWVRVLRVRHFDEDEFEDFASNLHGEFHWANLSADIPFAGVRGENIAHDVVEIVSSTGKKYYAVVDSGKINIVGVE